MEDTRKTFFLRLIAYFNIIVVAIVLADFFIPSNEFEGKIYEDWYNKVVKGGSVVGRRRTNVKTKYIPYIKSIDNEKFYISNRSILTDYLKPRDTFYVNRTRFFRVNKSIALQLPDKIIIERISLFNTSSLYFYILFALLSIILLFLKSSLRRNSLLVLTGIAVIVVTINYLFFY